MAVAGQTSRRTIHRAHCATSDADRTPIARAAASVSVAQCHVLASYSVSNIEDPSGTTKRTGSGSR